jgi:putative membrane protein
MMKSRLILILKGMAMGAADVVPGVSGGTIAFITGIYEELITSIRSVDGTAVKVLFKEGPKQCWKHINGNFLLMLVAGIAASILTLSKIIGYLLDHQPVLIWSFFTGLILASIVLIAKEITEWKLRVILSIALGTALSFWVTIAEPTDSPDGLVFIFFAGFLAIIAMILPGISGAFILLLLGAYGPLIETVNLFRSGLASMEAGILLETGTRIVIFVLGCILGLMSFSRILSWMFSNYRNSTLALLTGFMIGSLNKIWPWKETVISRIAHQGKENEAVVPFIQNNVWPWNFNHLNDVEQGLSVVPNKDPQMLFAILLIIFGIALITILQKFAPDHA